MLRTFPIAMMAMILALASPIVTAQDRPAPTASKAASTGKASGRIVNINTATAAELSDLPGVGQKTAERIIEYRQKNGPFKKAEDLMNVKGIGEKSFLKMKPQVAVAATR